MLMTVTEEQKRVIESQGYMVIQYKKWCYDILPKIYDIVNFYRKIISFFKDMANKIVVALEHISEVIKKITNTFKSCKKYMLDERPRYEFVRSLWRDYEVCKGNKVIYHRCRDRC